MSGWASMEGWEAAMALIRQAASDEKIRLAAICAAPTLLARAGLLPKGAHAVCYPGMEGALAQAGVIPEMDRSAVIDGRLITGRAAGSAFDFGLAIVEALEGIQAAAMVAAGLVYNS